MQKLVLLVGLITIFTLVSTLPAFASNAQVNITPGNSTMGCPNISLCFLPYQVTISVGDTITWTNLDNKTHTATTGTTNYGAVGNFDSGAINPGKSYTQFFGMVGKFRYFDSYNPSVTGVVMVVKQSDHAELAWVNGSLNVIDHLGNVTSTPIAGNSAKITKNIYNSGTVDAPSILFRLKIKNSTNFLVYDNIVYANIGAKQTVPISFSWLPEKPGNYQLFFDADPANTIGDTNENNDVTYDNLMIFNETKPAKIPVITPTYYNTTLVPEFGQLAPIILATSVTLIVVISSRLKVSNLP